MYIGSRLFRLTSRCLSDVVKRPRGRPPKLAVGPPTLEGTPLVAAVVANPRGRPRKSRVAVVVPSISDTAVPLSSAEASIPGVSGLWNWVPPSSVREGRDDDEVIAVLEGKLLTGDEIKVALTKLGGEDVVVVKLLDKLDTISEMVIATGRSLRQIRKMADVVVRALKARKLKQALGITGAEGDKDDDWLLVDCHNCVVHLMLPETRAELDLERHWGKYNNEQRSELLAKEGAEDY